MLSRIDIRRLTLIQVFHGVTTAGWWLLLVGAPLLAAWHALTSPRGLTVPVGVPDSAVTTNGVMVSDIAGRVDAVTLDRGPELTVIGLWLAGVLVWLPVVWLLRRFTRSVLRDGPFRETAVRVLPWIGAALIAIAVVQGYLTTVMSEVAATGGLDGVPVRPSGSLMLAGFVVIGLGEVFRHGQTLQRGEDLTI